MQNYNSTAEVAQPAPPSPMDESLDIVAHRLEELDSVVAGLRNRLDRIMRPEAPTLPTIAGKAVQEVEPVRSHYVDRTRTSAQHIEVICSQLAGFLARLDA